MSVELSEYQLRAAVDKAIRSHLDRRAAANGYLSHTRFTLPWDSDGTPTCLIGPSVQYVHHGSCQSLGC